MLWLVLAWYLLVLVFAYWSGKVLSLSRDNDCFPSLEISALAGGKMWQVAMLSECTAEMWG